MDRAWLETQLAAGRSMESIAREVGRDPSTVAYWVNKHGLSSARATRHAARGPIPRETLAALVELGRSVREIARVVDRSPTTVRHWLRRHGLETQPARYAGRGPAKPQRVVRECGRHGWVDFVPSGATGQFRCPLCVARAVSERRREVKRVLVAEAGGRCARCGYDRCAAALRSGSEGVRTGGWRDRQSARAAAVGSAKVRATVRELPR